MAKKSLTEIRNAKRVGNNSKSYDEKHPENPVSLRPIHDVKQYCIKIGPTGHIVDDRKKLALLKFLSALPKPVIAEHRFLIAQA